MVTQTGLVLLLSLNLFQNLSFYGGFVLFFIALLLGTLLNIYTRDLITLPLLGHIVLFFSFLLMKLSGNFPFPPNFLTILLIITIVYVLTQWYVNIIEVDGELPRFDSFLLGIVIGGIVGAVLSLFFFEEFYINLGPLGKFPLILLISSTFFGILIDLLKKDIIYSIFWGLRDTIRVEIIRRGKYIRLLKKAIKMGRKFYEKHYDDPEEVRESHEKLVIIGSILKKRAWIDVLETIFCFIWELIVFNIFIYLYLLFVKAYFL